MAQKSLLELAKQGDPEAIATLINQTLRTKGILADISLKHHCLQVLLEADQVPDERLLVPFVHRGVLRLGTHSIHRIKIYARQAGESFFAWNRDITLEPDSVPSHPHEVAGTRSPLSSTQARKAELLELPTTNPSRHGSGSSPVSAAVAQGNPSMGRTQVVRSGADAVYRPTPLRARTQTVSRTHPRPIAPSSVPQALPTMGGAMIHIPRNATKAAAERLTVKRSARNKLIREVVTATIAIILGISLTIGIISWLEKRSYSRGTLIEPAQGLAQ